MLKEERSKDLNYNRLFLFLQVNSEYYPGWLDNWGLPQQTMDADVIGKYFEKILALNASVNMYMFEGN